MTRGALLSFSDPVAGAVPTVVPFQYDPAEVTRVLRVQAGAGGASGLRVSGAPVESYALRVELDALAAYDRPLTAAMGVGPLLAAVEAMLEPGGGGAAALVGAVSGALAGAVGALGGSAPAPPVPSPSLPLVVLAWGPGRVVPVRVDGFTARETGFDQLLQPVQAVVDLTLTVLRADDLGADQALARAMATAHQAVRTARAVVGVAQGLELAT